MTPEQLDELKEIVERGRDLVMQADRLQEMYDAIPKLQRLELDFVPASEGIKFLTAGGDDEYRRLCSGYLQLLGPTFFVDLKVYLSNRIVEALRAKKNSLEALHPGVSQA